MVRTGREWRLDGGTRKVDGAATLLLLRPVHHVQCLCGASASTSQQSHIANSLYQYPFADGWLHLSLSTTSQPISSDLVCIGLAIRSTCAAARVPLEYNRNYLVAYSVVSTIHTTKYPWLQLQLFRQLNHTWYHSSLDLASSARAYASTILARTSC